MSFATAALFFVKYWRRTHDSLFMFFSAAFLLLAINQLLTAFSTIPLEERTNLYLLRLCAFLLILVGILLKNRSAADRR